MGEKGLDFKHKEVINVTDATRLGYVQDVTADLKTGVITSIIVPGNNKMFNIFSGNNDVIIPWEKIRSIRRRNYISRNIVKITKKRTLEKANKVC